MPDFATYQRFSSFLTGSREILSPLILLERKDLNVEDAIPMVLSVSLQKRKM